MSDEPIKFEPKKEPEGIIRPDEAKPEEVQQPFQCAIGEDGVMLIRLDLKAAIDSEGNFHALRGFLDSKRDEALRTVNQVRAEMAKQKALIKNVESKNGTQTFLNKLLRRK